MPRIDKNGSLGPASPLPLPLPLPQPKIGQAAPLDLPRLPLDQLKLGGTKGPEPSVNKPRALLNRVADLASRGLAVIKQVGGNLLEAGKSAFMRALFGPIKDRLETREVLDNPDTESALPAALARATRDLVAREAEELKAIGQLGERGKQYERLAALMGDDVMARHALMTMLLDGRLTGGKDLRGGKDMLSHLARMAEGPLAAGIDRQALLTNVVEELENPTKISQRSKGTCVATSATILLARENPTEYARLVADLATPGGKTQLQNGQVLQRESDWQKPDGGRTPSVALLQPALMEYGNFFLGYDNDADRSRGPFGLKIHGGLSHWGADRLLEGLTGRTFGNVFVTRFNRESVWKRVEASLAEGKSVPVGLFWSNGGSSGHQVLLDKIEGDWVYLTNPWGQQERAKLSEVKQHLSSAQIPDA